jgi:uncharacterized alpha-E superfamily protein
MPGPDWEAATKELQVQLRSALRDLARYERNQMATEDANSLADPTQVRRTVLAAAHQDALRQGGEAWLDGKVVKLADIEKAIQAEYKDGPAA